MSSAGNAAPRLNSLLETEDLDRLTRPPWTAPGEVAAALRALADPSDLDRQGPYHRVLYALGNDHAGTYFPVAVPAVAALGETLRSGSPIARLRALDVLLDLVGSFCPEPCYAEIETVVGPRPLNEVLRETANAIRVDVEHRRRNPECDEEAMLAGELLGLIDE